MQNSPDVIGDKFCLAIQRQDVSQQHVLSKKEHQYVLWQKMPG